MMPHSRHCRNVSNLINYTGNPRSKLYGKGIRLANLTRIGDVMTTDEQIMDNSASTVVSPVGNTATTARSRRAARNPEYARLWAEFAVARAIAQQFIKYRMAHNLTQEELAKRAGTSHSQISRLESGQHHSSVATLERIADALDLELSITFTPRPAILVATD